MVSQTSFVSLALALAKFASAGFSSASWQVAESNASSSYITHVGTTLKVPSVPSQQGLLLWPGLYTEENWLVQSIIGNEADYLEDFCATKSGNEWCLFTYAYKGGLKNNPAAKGTIVKEGDLLDIEYEYDEHTSNTTQTVTLEGKVLSKLSVATGAGYRFQDTIECHGHYNGSTPDHQYLNTTIVLAESNPGFGNSVKHPSSSPSSVSSSDGGKTWSIPKIEISPSTCTSTG